MTMMMMMICDNDLDRRLAVIVLGTLFVGKCQFALKKLEFTSETFLLTHAEQHHSLFVCSLIYYKIRTKTLP